MLDMCALAAEENWPIFLYGGKEGVAHQLAERLVVKFPSLRIVGTLSPPFRPLTENEIAQEISEINASGARLVFVGIGTPKQDRWMASRIQHLDANVLFGVGAAFDFHTGLVRQAPRWMQRSGFEWLFRLATEPRRLAGRYLRNNPAFLIRILRHPPQRLTP
jgi:N-acetylglucosaminyldiphosphoundecaprenol N-acetyl-beta-D-mannosaminyltransferase